MSDLSFEISPFRHSVSLVNLKFPWHREEIINELEQEEWRPFGMDTSVEHNVWTGKRYKVIHPRSRRLLAVKHYLQDQMEYVVQSLYQHKHSLHTTWQMYPWRLAQNVTMHAEFTRDLPGFENGIHLDNRMLFATGMIYLTDEHRDEWSSCFYDNYQQHNPVIIPSGFGQGWVHANDYDTWHDGWNRTDQVRYSILFALTLKFENQPTADDNPNKP
jgi:hypothetical protein